MEINSNLDVIKTNILNWVTDNLGIDFKFRKYQLESIMFIIKSIINDNRETSIIEAPTGSGKSLISIICAGVLSKYYKKESYILCSDLFLWQQYADVINKYNLKTFGYLKGSLGNYTCFINKQDLQNGRCKLEKISYQQLKDKKWCERNFYNCVNTCVYMQQRFRAERSPVTLMTYQLWLYHMNLVNMQKDKITFNTRPVIFCDECHNIPNIVQQYCSPIINNTKDISKIEDILTYASDNNLFFEKKLPDKYKLKDYLDNENNKNILHYYNNIVDNSKIKRHIKKIYKDIIINKDNSEKVFELLESYKDILKIIASIIEVIEDDMKSNNVYNIKNPSKEFISLNNKISWFNTYYTSLINFITAINTAGVEFFIVETNYDEEKKETTINLNCVKEDYLCFTYLLTHAKHKVLLSATVGMHSAYDDNIGIQYTTDKTSYMSKIPSTFNFDNSPIYYIPTYKMNYQNKLQDFPKIQQLCFKILNSTLDKRGIIHTGSYENAKLFYSNAPNDIKKRLFIYGNSKQKDEIMDEFKYSKNGVLVGPTLTEGIDLPNDYCRFIILMKVPYPNITSNIVKKKIELFENWYNSTTSNIIIQSIGRGIRNENDYCTTYILDGCFGSLYQKTLEQYPDYIKNRIKIIMP